MFLTASCQRFCAIDSPCPTCPFSTSVRFCCAILVLTSTMMKSINSLPERADFFVISVSDRRLLTPASFRVQLLPSSSSRVRELVDCGSPTGGRMARLRRGEFKSAAALFACFAVCCVAQPKIQGPTGGQTNAYYTASQLQASGNVINFIQVIRRKCFLLLTVSCRQTCQAATCDAHA